MNALWLRRGHEANAPTFCGTRQRCARSASTKAGWWVFRAALAGTWLLVLSVTVHASTVGGPNGWIGAMVADMHQPWPAQFDTDFTVHLFLMATWLAVRAKNLAWGVLWVALALLGGSLFSLLYLLVLSFQVRGDVRRFLLGRWAI